MIDLNRPETMAALDPGEMHRRIAELPDQLVDAWAQMQALELPAGLDRVRQVVILGMGGSAIGGDLARSLAEPESQVPILVNREYTVPAFVGPDTLVIASSYSGNTEETLAACQAAHTQGARLIAVTTGGKLADLARTWRVHLFTFKYRSQPRAALGYSFAALLSILQKLGFVKAKDEDMAEASALLKNMQRDIGIDAPASQNPAKQLAQRLASREPIVYGAGFLSDVARRWKTQFNENAKTWAAFDVLSELNHNTVVGYQFPDDVSEHVFVVMLRSALDYPRNRARFDVTVELLDRYHVPHATVEGQGHSALAQMLSLVHFGDYVTYYLALLNRVDPTPVAAIDILKSRLAQAG